MRILTPLQTFRRDYFFWVLLGVLMLLTALEPGRIFIYPSLVDWSTIAALTGLLVLTKGVELSGFLHHLGKHLVELMPTERALAMFLVLAAALLSTLLTNDVALFVVVPLTVGLRTVSTLPVTRLIVFEALG